MQPGNILGKALDEHGAGDGPSKAATGVLHVRHVALQLLLVHVVPDGQLPGQLTNRLRSAPDLVSQVGVVAHKAGHLAAERHQAGAGERGEVHDTLGLIALGVGDPVGQDEPPFRVGVDDLDGRPVQRPQDVAGPDGLAAGHVLGCRDQADDPQRHAEAADGAHGTEHRRAPGHVHLHLLHPGRRLDGGAAGIEGHAFPHQDERRLLGRALRLVLDDNERRRLARSARYPQQSAHPFGLDGVVVEHGAAQTGLAGYRGRRCGERAWRQVVPRPIDQITCPADGVGNGLALTQPLAQRSELGLVEFDYRQALDIAVGLARLFIRALELAEPIEAE